MATVERSIASLKVMARVLLIGTFIASFRGTVASTRGAMTSTTMVVKEKALRPVSMLPAGSAPSTVTV